MPGKTTVYTYEDAGNRKSLSETYISDQSSGIIDEVSGSEIKYRIMSSQYTYFDTDTLLKLVESMKNAPGNEVLSRTTRYEYDSNGNQLEQRVGYTKPVNTSAPETFSIIVSDNPHLLLMEV